MILIKILYSLIVNIRNFLYDWEVLASYQSSIPIISLGNITTGGTGKTPLAISLVEYLNKKTSLKKNGKTLIITRGYKRTSSGQVLLKKGHTYSASYVGDEPFLMSKMCAADILINKNRVAAVKWAEKQNIYKVIILDDGFQHRAIKRDFNILLINPLQKMMAYPPTGDLREPMKNIKRADFIIYTKATPGPDLHSFCDSFSVPSVSATIDFKIKYNRSKKFLSGISFCGVGSPESFVEGLKKMNINIKENVVLKDHQKYCSQSIKKIESILKRNKETNFFTTKKDWVKLPKEFINKYNGAYLDMALSVPKDSLNSAFWKTLRDRLYNY